MIDSFDRSRSARISSRARPSRWPRGRSLEERPEPIANVRRQDAFQVLEGRAAQPGIVGMETAIGNLQRGRSEARATAA